MNKKKILNAILLLLASLMIATSMCGCAAEDILSVKTTNSTTAAYENNEKSTSAVTKTEKATELNTKAPVDEKQTKGDEQKYAFKSSKLLNQHYEKHGIEMGFKSAQEYESAASAVVNNPNALHKTEAEDGDDVYYLENSNEFVIVSTEGYIRTYFLSSGGKSYYDRQ